jgi:hypothetical protein
LKFQKNAEKLSACPRFFTKIAVSVEYSDRKPTKKPTKNRQNIVSVSKIVGFVGFFVTDKNRQFLSVFQHQTDRDFVGGHPRLKGQSIR